VAPSDLRVCLNENRRATDTASVVNNLPT
jgi:hypothetical protein